MKKIGMKRIVCGIICVVMLVSLTGCTKKQAGYYKFESFNDPSKEYSTWELAMMKMFSSDIFIILDSDGTGFFGMDVLGQGENGEINWEDNELIGPNGNRLEFEYDGDTEQITLSADGVTMIFQKITDETEINRMKSKRKQATKEKNHANTK